MVKDEKEEIQIFTSKSWDLCLPKLSDQSPILYKTDLPCTILRSVDEVPFDIEILKIHLRILKPDLKPTFQIKLLRLCTIECLSPI